MVEVLTLMEPVTAAQEAREGGWDRMVMAEGVVLAELAIATDQVVRAVVAVAGHIIRPVAVSTKHTEQATADDDIPETGGRRIAWRQPPALDEKARLVAAVVLAIPVP